MERNTFKGLAREIGQHETPKRLEKRRGKMRAQAGLRIDAVLSGKDDDTEGTKKQGKLHFLAQKVLKVYGLPDDQIRGLSVVDAHSVASKLVASDLLLVEFYNADGQTTDFAETHYPDVNPEDYSLIDGPWPRVKTILEKRLKASGWKRDKDDNNEYLGTVGLKIESDDDVVAEYARAFGKKSIIAIPFRMNFDISPSHIIHYEDDFEAPYGGNGYVSRLIFVPRE